MKYRNAADILPEGLLFELQRYVEGETLYIPKACGQKKWGEKSGSREYYRERNQRIKQLYKGGKTIGQLSEEFSLAEDTIKKIIYRCSI